MRLFVGIPVAGEVLGALSGILGRYRGAGWPVKWVRDDALHLTLKFLGAVPAEQLAQVGDALGTAGRGTGALPFGLNGSGAFPSLERPRVLWAGLQSEPALELLVDRLERRFEALGFPIEGRPFRPHVTLGRVRDHARLPADAARRWESETPAGEFVAGELLLYQSRTGPEGASYEVLERVALES